MFKRFLMRPPAWLKRILDRIPAYRVWFIREVCKQLHNDAINSFLKEKGIDNA